MTDPYHPKTCQFSVKTSAKEVISPIRVRQVMESDYSARKTNEQPMSQDGRKFMVKMKIRNLSKKRRSLRNALTVPRRRTQNAQYYVAFMNDLVEKKCAQRVPDQEPSNHDVHTWYIPHHGVYQPQKTPQRCVLYLTSTVRLSTRASH